MNAYMRNNHYYKHVKGKLEKGQHTQIITQNRSIKITQSYRNSKTIPNSHPTYK